MDKGAEYYKRYLEGDDSAFMDIIREYNDGLVLYLNGIVNNINTADELSEDTFVKLALRKPPFSLRSSFKTWLYRIGHNLAVDHLRKLEKNNVVPLEDIPEMSSETDLESRFIKEEKKETLYRAMKDLSPDQRQVLWLFYFEGFSNKEIAAVMKKSVHAVETLIYRARESLKTILKKEDFF